MDKTHIQSCILTRPKFDFTVKQVHEELCAAWGQGYVPCGTVVD